MNTGIFFYSDSARAAMKNIIAELPEEVQVYLVGGAVRNALIRKYLDENWLQRDYDQALTKNPESYFQFLESKGFAISAPSDAHHQIMAKPVVENARKISYEDNLVFDMHIVDDTTIEDNLRFSTGLSINGFAISLRDIFDEEWEGKIISLPGALDSIKNKRIDLNQEGYTSESNYFFALLRFVGVGFSAPPREDIIKLLKTVTELSTERYLRNLTKLVDYVGGEEKLKTVVNRLGIDGLDILDEVATKKLASNIL